MNLDPLNSKSLYNYFLNRAKDISQAVEEQVQESLEDITGAAVNPQICEGEQTQLDETDLMQALQDIENSARRILDSSRS